MIEKNIFLTPIDQYYGNENFEWNKKNKLIDYSTPNKAFKIKKTVNESEKENKFYLSFLECSSSLTKQIEEKDLKYNYDNHDLEFFQNKNNDFLTRINKMEFENVLCKSESSESKISLSSNSKHLNHINDSKNASICVLSSLTNSCSNEKSSLKNNYEDLNNSDFLQLQLQEDDDFYCSNNFKVTEEIKINKEEEQLNKQPLKKISEFFDKTKIQQTKNQITNNLLVYSILTTPLNAPNRMINPCLLSYSNNTSLNVNKNNEEKKPIRKISETSNSTSASLESNNKIKNTERFNNQTNDFKGINKDNNCSISKESYPIKIKKAKKSDISLILLEKQKQKSKIVLKQTGSVK